MDDIKEVLLCLKEYADTIRLLSFLFISVGFGGFLYIITEKKESKDE